jgi:hypothetical protein
MGEVLENAHASFSDSLGSEQNQSVDPMRKRTSRIIFPAKALLQFPQDVDLG